MKRSGKVSLPMASRIIAYAHLSEKWVQDAPGHDFCCPDTEIRRLRRLGPYLLARCSHSSRAYQHPCCSPDRSGAALLDERNHVCIRIIFYELICLPIIPQPGNVDGVRAVAGNACAVINHGTAKELIAFPTNHPPSTANVALVIMMRIMG